MKSDYHTIFPRIHLGPMTHFLFLTALFWNENVYLMFDYILETGKLSGFTGSQLESSFYLRMNHNSGLTHT